jgi:hypothetical protein
VTGGPVFTKLGMHGKLETSPCIVLPVFTIQEKRADSRTSVMDATLALFNLVYLIDKYGNVLEKYSSLVW